MGAVVRERILSVTIHDCEVQTFRSGGPGGQNQNKRDTGVRVIHHPSGARGESREERSQLQNKREAFIRMTRTPAFQSWMKIECGRDAVRQSVVCNDLRRENLRIEGRDGGQWVEIT